MTFRLVKFNSCLKVVNRTQQARTYFLNVFKYTHCIYSVSLHHIHCTLYTYIHKYPHSTSTASATAAVAWICVARKLYICQTSKQTNKCSHYTQWSNETKIAAKNQFTTNNEDDNDDNPIPKVIAHTNTHCSEIKHQTPHATSTIHFQCIKSISTKSTEIEVPLLLLLCELHDIRKTKKDKKTNIFSLTTINWCTLSCKTFNAHKQSIHDKTEGYIFHQAQFTWLHKSSEGFVSKISKWTQHLCSARARIFLTKCLMLMHEGWA